MPIVIDASGVYKAYGDVQALHDVSFQIDAGEVVGLLGPNGAGKTTLMKVLTGFLQLDEGQVLIDDLDVLTDTLAVQSRIGYLPESAPLYPESSVQSHLSMMADLRRVPPEQKVRLISQAVRATALEHQLTRPISELSKGYRQRVGLAQTILHQPKLLVLDEPTSGLDPVQIVEVRHLIRRLAQRSTVLLSTHILSEVEAVCDRVIILLNGQVKADSLLSDLSSQAVTVLALGHGEQGVTGALLDLEGVRRVESRVGGDGVEYQVSDDGKQDLRPAIFALAKERDWALRELRREARTLETVFNQLVSETGDNQPSPELEAAA